MNEPTTTPVRSAGELARVLEVVGAQLDPPLSAGDPRFADLHDRFDQDAGLMLVVERDGELVGGALAFRSSPRQATLRVLGLVPAARGQGLGRVLLRMIEEAAGTLGPTP
jgi:GNAT superfamily N-acetyltransferase